MVTIIRKLTPVKTQTNWSRHIYEFRIFNSYQYRFIDVCILIFYKSGPLPWMYCPPSPYLFLSLIVDRFTQWGASPPDLPIKIQHLRNPVVQCMVDKQLIILMVSAVVLGHYNNFTTNGTCINKCTTQRL